MEKAIEYLRKKGLAKAAKKAGAHRHRGHVASYIHGGAHRRAGRGQLRDRLRRAQRRLPGLRARSVAMQIAAMNPRTSRRTRSPAAVIEKEKAHPHRAGEAVGQARGGGRQDRRGPDREVGEGGLPARSGLGEGSRGQEGHPRAAHRAGRQDRREHQESAASSASRSARGSRRRGRLRRRSRRSRRGRPSRTGDPTAEAEGASARREAAAANGRLGRAPARRRRAGDARPQSPHGCRSRPG